jgi:uncharacterized protein
MESSELNPGRPPERLDVRALAKAGGMLHGRIPLNALPRLEDELHPQPVKAVAEAVEWAATGEMRADVHGLNTEIWLRLQIETTLPLQCQRCLESVETPVAVDRWFRFVADEATAELLDDDSDEDLLSLEAPLSLLELIEDELLMSLPLVPMHEICPTAVRMQAADPGASPAEAERPNPFAALAQLKK